MEDKGTDVIGWKLKGLFPLHDVFLPTIKYFGYKIRIYFNKTPLVNEQNNYGTKIVNSCIVYDLDNWQKKFCLTILH